MSILIPGMEMPDSCNHCRFAVDGWCYAYGKPNVDALANDGVTNWCPLVPIPKHSGLFDVGQFERGCFYGYGRDGKVYKLMWDTKVFDGMKKVYINPRVPADKEEQT